MTIFTLTGITKRVNFIYYQVAYTLERTPLQKQLIEVLKDFHHVVQVT